MSDGVGHPRASGTGSGEWSGMSASEWDKDDTDVACCAHGCHRCCDDDERSPL